MEFISEWSSFILGLPDKVAEFASNTAERVMVSEKDKGKPTESAEKLRSDQKASAGMPKINLQLNRIFYF